MTSHFSARNHTNPFAEVRNEQYSFGWRDVNHLKRFSPDLDCHTPSHAKHHNELHTIRPSRNLRLGSMACSVPR